MKSYLMEHNEKFNSDVQKLENQLAKNKDNVKNLSDEVVVQRNEIISLLKQVEGELLVQYENQVIGLKNQLDASTLQQIKQYKRKMVAAKLQTIQITLSLHQKLQRLIRNAKNCSA